MSTKVDPIIAIIDDEETSQFMTKVAIRRVSSASRIIHFFNGKEALQFLGAQSTNESELPDIILLDLNMPLMDGWTFLDEFELIRPILKKNIKIFILTSSIDQNDIDKAKDYFKVVSFFSKPLSKEMFELIMTAPDYYGTPEMAEILSHTRN